MGHSLWPLVLGTVLRMALARLAATCFSLAIWFLVRHTSTDRPQPVGYEDGINSARFPPRGLIANLMICLWCVLHNRTTNSSLVLRANALG
jgi:hypothetical protein